MSLDLQMILTRIDAVMIDLDGTMVDTMGDFEAALNLCWQISICPRSRLRW
jgi:hypothetical protein